MPDPIINQHMVAVRGDGNVLIRNPPLGGMTPAAALQLAAWLVALADRSPGHGDFLALLAAVEDA